MFISRKETPRRGVRRASQQSWSPRLPCGIWGRRRRLWPEIWINSEERLSGRRARSSGREDLTSVPHEDVGRQAEVRMGAACASRLVYPYASAP